MLFLLETVLGAEETRLVVAPDLALFRGGALSRFQRLHETYRSPLTRYVSRRLRPMEAAEDVVASTFEAAFRSLGKLRQSQDPYLWLLGIARRKLADVYRVLERKGTLPIPEDYPASEADPEALLLTLEQAGRIRAATFALPEEQREALLLQHLERLSQGEIAGLLGKSPQAVNSLQQRARQTLKRKLAPYFTELEEDLV